jgi:hypothetical protein
MTQRQPWAAQKTNNGRFRLAPTGFDRFCIAELRGLVKVA